MITKIQQENRNEKHRNSELLNLDAYLLDVEQGGLIRGDMMSNDSSNSNSFQFGESDMGAIKIPDSILIVNSHGLNQNPIWQMKQNDDDMTFKVQMKATPKEGANKIDSATLSKTYTLKQQYSNTKQSLTAVQNFIEGALDCKATSVNIANFQVEKEVVQDSQKLILNQSFLTPIIENIFQKVFEQKKNEIKIQVHVSVVQFHFGGKNSQQNNGGKKQGFTDLLMNMQEDRYTIKINKLTAKKVNSLQDVQNLMNEQPIKQAAKEAGTLITIRLTLRQCVQKQDSAWKLVDDIIGSDEEDLKENDYWDPTGLHVSHSAINLVFKPITNEDTLMQNYHDFQTVLESCSTGPHKIQELHLKHDITCKSHHYQKSSSCILLNTPASNVELQKSSLEIAMKFQNYFEKLNEEFQQIREQLKNDQEFYMYEPSQALKRTKTERFKSSKEEQGSRQRQKEQEQQHMFTKKTLLNDQKLFKDVIRLLQEKIGRHVALSSFELQYNKQQKESMFTQFLEMQQKIIDILASTINNQQLKNKKLKVGGNFIFDLHKVDQTRRLGGRNLRRASAIRSDNSFKEVRIGDDFSESPSHGYFIPPISSSSNEDEDDSDPSVKSYHIADDEESVAQSYRWSQTQMTKFSKKSAAPKKPVLAKVKSNSSQKNRKILVEVEYTETQELERDSSDQIKQNNNEEPKSKQSSAVKSKQEEYSSILSKSNEAKGEASQVSEFKHIVQNIKGESSKKEAFNKSSEERDLINQLIYNPNNNQEVNYNRIKQMNFFSNIQEFRPRLSRNRDWVSVKTTANNTGMNKSSDSKNQSLNQMLNLNHAVTFNETLNNFVQSKTDLQMKNEPNSPLKLKDNLMAKNEYTFAGAKNEYTFSGQQYNGSGGPEYKRSTSPKKFITMKSNKGLLYLKSMHSSDKQQQLSTQQSQEQIVKIDSLPHNNDLKDNRQSLKDREFIIKTVSPLKAKSKVNINDQSNQNQYKSTSTLVKATNMDGITKPAAISSNNIEAMMKQPAISSSNIEGLGKQAAPHSSMERINLFNNSSRKLNSTASESNLLQHTGTFGNFNKTIAQKWMSSRKASAPKFAIPGQKPFNSDQKIPVKRGQSPIKAKILNFPSQVQNQPALKIQTRQNKSARQDNQKEPNKQEKKVQFQESSRTHSYQDSPQTVFNQSSQLDDTPIVTSSQRRESEQSTPDNEKSESRQIHQEEEKEGQSDNAPKYEHPKAYDIMMFGDNRKGACGIMDKDKSKFNYVPKKIGERDGQFKVSKIASGYLHCLGINARGKLYSWGSNRSGQLGRPEVNDEQGQGPEPVLITSPILQNVIIKDIACGFQHSLAVSVEGQVYAWGLNVCGQLGIGANDTICNQPQLVRDINSRVKQISAGQLHSGAVTDDGQLYMWGHNPDCRLFQMIDVARAPGDRNVFTPQKSSIIDKELAGVGVPELKIKYLSCGVDHSMVIDEMGEVWAAGNSERGRLGVSEFEFIPKTCEHPYVKVQGLQHIKLHDASTQIEKVCCGDGFSIAMSNRGRVYSCGKGNFGRLGHGIEGNFDRMAEIHYFRRNSIYIVDIAAGGRHCLALGSRQLYVWGFNFYYQLGLYKEDDELEPVKNKYLTQRIKAIACGTMNSAVLVEDD